MIYPGTVLFAAPYSEDMLLEAKSYISKNNLTTENVKLKRSSTEEFGDQIFVVAIADIPWDLEARAYL